MLDEIIDMVVEQISWDLKRGAIDLVDREYIAERAEEILTPEQYEIFSMNDGATIVYQDGRF